MQIATMPRASAAAPSTSAPMATMHFRAGRQGEIMFSGPRDAGGPSRATYSYPALAGEARATVAMSPWRTAVLHRMLSHAMPVLGAPNSTSSASAGADKVRVVLDPDTTVGGDEQAWTLDASSVGGDRVLGHILTGIAYIHGNS